MQDFIKISRYAGMREDLVQAGGGNSSVKLSKDQMVIKASGYQLTDVTEEKGYSIVNPDIIRHFFMDSVCPDRITEAESTAILQKAFIKGEKPSIETFLHAVSDVYTLHTHPIVVNALTCREDGMEILHGLFPEALIIPYATPGSDLAKTYFGIYNKTVQNDRKTFEIVFLQNHGLLVSSNTADAVIRKTEKTVRTIEQFLACDMEAYHKVTELWTLFPQKIIWRVTDKHVYSAYEQYGGMWDHTFCPDCIVFLGKKTLTLPAKFSRQDVENFMADYGQPVVIRYGKELYLVADNVKKAMETQSVLSFSAQVMMLNQEKPCKFLSNKEQDFLLGWDAEKYRKNMR